MAIGYECPPVGVPGIKFKTCRKEDASDEKLKELISYNLVSLDNMLDYNIKNDIKLLRISSDIIPFGSHSMNKLDWWKIFEKELLDLGKKAKNNNIRLSIYPDHDILLNSPRIDLVEKSIKNLINYTRFLDALKLDKSNKIVLLLGGAYGEKKKAISCFKENYRILNKSIKNRLVIENDDKIFNLEEILNIVKELEIPVIYDNLQNRINSSFHNTDKYWIEEVGKTWKKVDGRQIIHYSQQVKDKKIGFNSKTIDIKIFIDFYDEIFGNNIDIMLKANDRNLSAIKCINAVENLKIKELEKEWARYKYLVLEHSPQIYNEIRSLLKNKAHYPVEEFYELVDKALEKDLSTKYIINAGDHVWGYFRKKEDDNSREIINQFYKNIEKGGTTKPLKKYLWKLSKKYKEKYLLESLYFMEIL